MKKSYWLLKTEPSTFSFPQLQKDKTTNWNGVRNYQARNNLRAMNVDDLALIYHSGDDKAVVGLARVIRPAYPDVDPDGGDWAQVDLECVEPFAKPVTLTQIKKEASLEGLPLIRHSRLSVMPVTEAHYKILRKMGGL